MNSSLQSALSTVFIFDGDQAPIAILDREGEVLYGNQVWASLGIKDVVKTSSLKSIQSRDRHPFLENWPTEGNSQIWQVEGLEDENDKPAGWWVRGKGSPELIREIQDYNRMINASTDSLTMISSDYRYQLCNDAFTLAKGLSREDVLGKTITEVWGEVNFRNYIKPHLDRALKGNVVNYQLWIQFSEDVRRYVDVTYWPYREDGETTHVVVNTHDITEIKMVEMELQENLKKAEMASVLKSRFLANMSHEIRTPLNGVIASASMIEKDHVRKEAQEYLEIIESSSQTLKNLVNDILDNAKIEAGKLELETIRFSPRKSIDEIAELFRFQASAKQIRLTTLLDSSLPHFLLGDPNRLKQILTNLVSNALKYTAEGEITVQVECLPRDGKVLPLRFRVEDTGKGMDEQVLEHLFSPFQQGDTSIHRKYGGAGLGLHIAKSLTELMDGEIGVSSRVDVGSEFWFIVRLEVLDSDESGLETDGKIDGSRILAFHPVVNSMDHLMLPFEELGAEVQCISHPDEVLRWPSDREPNLIICGASDLEMGLPIKKKFTDKFSKAQYIHIAQEGKRGESKLAWESGYSAYLTGHLEFSSLGFVIQTLLAGQPEQILTRFSLNEQSQTVAGRSVLVCEDNTINQKLVIRILEKVGYHVDLAENGLKGCEAAKKRHYDLILMDLRMPEMDGVEATKIIRQDPRNEKTFILALTGDAVQGVREECLDAGMNGFLAKPYTKKDLLQCLAQLS